MSHAILATPIGLLRLAAAGDRLAAVRILARQPDTSGEAIPECSSPLLEEACRQLAAWFDGRLDNFDLPLADATSTRGGALRSAIMAVPYGRTANYGGVAQAIGSSARAIGQACARNPLPLIVPCHRIVGADGAIGHYSAGDGVATKRWLLNFEARRLLWAA